MKRNLLIIDDNVDFCHMLQRVLRAHKVYTLHSWEEIESFRNDQMIDLILLDYHFGVHTACEVQALLKSIEYLRDSVVILITGDDSVLNGGQGLDIDDIIIKPFALKDLQQKVDKHLNSLIVRQ